MSAERYAGRPLLIVLEGWVLECIGQLPEDKRGAIAEIVQGAFGGGDDWRATLRRTLGVDRGVEALIAAEWGNVQEASGGDRSAEAFARDLIDRDYVHLLEGT